MKLTYLTSNPFKFREAKLILVDQYGIDLDIMNPDFELYEIQAKTCAEVVAFTVKYGADKLGKACLKSDTGLYLDALGRLPGPYNAYFDKQILTFASRRKESQRSTRALFRLLRTRWRTENLYR